MIDIDEYKEALEALKSGFLDTADLEPYMQNICNALEKQIPKKFVGRLSTLDINCPCCNGEDIYDIPNRRIVKQNYCPNCGQALDWSSENE